MKTQSVSPSSRTMMASALLAGLATFSITVVPAPADELLAGIASNGRLVLFSSADPSDVDVVQVRGLAQGERILGLDTRPATGQLYALGSTSRLYTLDPISGIASPVGTMPFSPALSGTTFGFDFNPTVDRIRIVSDSGQNMRAHPHTARPSAASISPEATAPRMPAWYERVPATPIANARRCTRSISQPATQRRWARSVGRGFSAL